MRLAVQSAAAAALAWVAVTLIGTDQAFLAVISAVLVLEPNRHATLDSALQRLLGAMAGTIVGLAAMALGEPLGLPWTLAAAMLVMGGIVAWKPELRYGVVAAAGLAVGSDQGFVDTAWTRGVAIFVGAAAGLLVGWALLPESAPSRARRQLSEAPGCCRKLLDRSFVSLLDEEDAELSELHGGFSRSIADAADTIDTLPLRRSSLGRSWYRAVHGAERLWHAIIILDRVSEAAGSGLEIRSEVSDLLRRVRSQASEALDCLVCFEPVSERDLEELRNSCSGAHDSAREIEAEAVEASAFIFGLTEVARNIREIDESIRQLQGVKRS